MTSKIFALFVATVILVGTSDAAVIDGYEMATNDRFAQSPNFIGAAHDWSGVGMTTGGRWATLIGSNTIVSAGHFQPSGRINFFPGTDPSVSAVRRDIIDGQRIADTDLWLGCLDDSAPDQIAVYDYTTTALTPATYSEWDHASATAFVVGRSAGSYPTVQDQAVGRNKIVAYSNNDPFNSGLGESVDTLNLVYDPIAFGSITNPNYVAFESLLEVGDSGAPLFVDMDGDLVLLGINSFVMTTTSTTSHVSYLGNEADQVQSFVTHCIQQVPEPGSNGLGVLGCMMMLLAVRRNLHSVSSSG